MVKITLESKENERLVRITCQLHGLWSPDEKANKAEIPFLSQPLCRGGFGWDLTFQFWLIYEYITEAVANEPLQLSNTSASTKDDFVNNSNNIISNFIVYANYTISTHSIIVQTSLLAVAEIMMVLTLTRNSPMKLYDCISVWCVCRR